MNAHLRRGVVLAALLFLLPSMAQAADALRNPRVLREGQVDTTSAESIIAAIIKPGMTQREKAEAVYHFLRTHVYHAPAPREGPKPDDFAYGVVYDPVKLINVYGYTYCFGNRSALEALWQVAGLEARSAGITGHSIAEVFYDGAYHFYDADQHGYCLLPDGKTVASIAQIENDPIGLLLKQPNPSKPFFPATADPKVPYESKVICAGYFASKTGAETENFYQHDKTVLQHHMGITLVPGMRYIRNFAGDGRYNYRPKTVEFEAKVGYFDPLAGPRDFLSDKTYGNGELLWQPDLRKSTGEYAAGVWQDENIAQDETGLTPKDASKPAWAVFRVKLPYIIEGWPTSWTSPPKPVGAALVSARFEPGELAHRDIFGISVSVNDGRTWTPVWTNEPGKADAVVDLSEHVVHRYGYLVRFEITPRLGSPPGPTSSPPGHVLRPSRLSQVTIRTAFQLAPSSLPALRRGANRMTFSLGDGTESESIEPDIGDREAFTRTAHSCKGIWLEDGAIRGRYGRTGEVVYELVPPKPGTIAHIGAGAGLRREAFGLHHLDDFKIWVAENEPKDWKLIYDDDVPPYMQHWSYEASARADCTPGTKKAYVKFAIRTEASVCIQRLWLRMNWRPEGETGMPARGVKVAHIYATKPGAEPVRFEKVITSAPTEYIVDVPAGPEAELVNKSIIIEPVRDARCAWREGDALVERPAIEAPALLDVKLRDEWRMLLRNIDLDPDKWLPIAAKTSESWLAGGAQQAIQMFKTRYPIQPPAPAPVPALDAERRAELVKAVQGKPPVMVVDEIATLLCIGDAAGQKGASALIADPNTYLKLRFIGKVADFAVPSVPDELLPGLKDDSRWVRVAVLQLVRRAPSPAARKAVEAMAANDPLDWLREEAKSVLAATAER